jgi:hypothetical protein
MNPRTVAARSAPLSFVAANEDQTPNAGFSVDFQDLCSLAMDQALGIEKASSLTPVVDSNSCLLDIYKNAFCIAPVLSNLSDAAAQVVASCVEFQMGLFALLAPNTLSHVSTVASSSSSQHEPTAEELAFSMDIALGERFTAPRSTVTSISGGQARPQRKVKAQVLEHSMDIAIGARAA